jgi:hypothetical protein
MEDLLTNNSVNFDWGRRFFIILAFLAALWLFLNYLVLKIKSKSFKIPTFLTDKFPVLKNIQSQVESQNEHSMKIIQNKILPDGSELMILDIDGRRMLLSRSMSGGLRYLTDIKASENP